MQTEKGSSEQHSAATAVRTLTQEVRSTLKFLNGSRTIVELEDERGHAVRVHGVIRFFGEAGDGIREDGTNTFFSFSEYAVSRFV